jgi:hypothetical protein
VDTKIKELVGEFKKGGRERTPRARRGGRVHVLLQLPPAPPSRKVPLRRGQTRPRVAVLADTAAAVSNGDNDKSTNRCGVAQKMPAPQHLPYRASFPRRRASATFPPSIKSEAHSDRRNTSDESCIVCPVQASNRERSRPLRPALPEWRDDPETGSPPTCSLSPAADRAWRAGRAGTSATLTRKNSAGPTSEVTFFRRAFRSPLLARRRPSGSRVGRRQSLTAGP